MVFFNRWMRRFWTYSLIQIFSSKYIQTIMKKEEYDTKKKPKKSYACHRGKYHSTQ